jgi:opacity protein-like surface antigen
MKRTILLVIAAAALSAGHAQRAYAQSGFALKGHFIVNSSDASDARQNREIPDADGFDVGAEFVLPIGLGIGVSGYSASQKFADSDMTAREFTVLGEANYFLRLPYIPIAPYAGIHAGLGRLSQDDVTDPDLKLGDDSRSQLGYQFGLRFQPTSMLGVDAQWRHMSTSTAAGQSGRFERNQVLLGITLF